jgi:hypothetical protein
MFLRARLPNGIAACGIYMDSARHYEHDGQLIRGEPAYDGEYRLHTQLVDETPHSNSSRKEFQRDFHASLPIFDVRAYGYTV